MAKEMENVDEEDDVKLVKASATLLSDLEAELPKLLWKRSAMHESSQKQKQKRVHTRVRKCDLERVINLIEPFQGEPQLLDAKLKTVLPPLVEAYLESLAQTLPHVSSHHNIQTAVCTLLYTFCKVRGPKIIVGFLSNEPRHLEPILEALEATLTVSSETPVSWQIPYVLLLWLSHLLLTPFDLDSISTRTGPPNQDQLPGHPLPPLPARILRVGLAYLPVPTKAQEAAAAMLVRFCIRPDVLKLRLADRLVDEQLPKLSNDAGEVSNAYEVLGALRLVAGVVAATELSHLVPRVYHKYQQAVGRQGQSFLNSNAVAKKIGIKLFRNVSILSMRSATNSGALSNFLQTTGVLEEVIDYLLQSLRDRDTPVRYAAAKSISLIILELDPEMGHEVIQAVLDSFKEDMPKAASVVDFATVDPLRWHGLTLTLAHSLFKRSASPNQLPDIFDALIFALQFQQRTSTGALLGTNVRDAANFGIWSLARRYTTAELLPVKISALHNSNQIGTDTSIIQLMATQLVLSACLDPAGNIRRGSSAALQELVGRHPDQVFEGIALVQTVDYQAVSLRKRAMIDVTNNAAALHPIYASSLVDSLFDWRGLWSADTTSRQSAAQALSHLATSSAASAGLLEKTMQCINLCSTREVENLHGYGLTAANLMERLDFHEQLPAVAESVKIFKTVLQEFSPRTLRSELPAAIARFITATCSGFVRIMENNPDSLHQDKIPIDSLENIVDRLLWRHESWILEEIPSLVRSMLQLRRKLGQPLGCLGAQTLCKRVSSDGSKSTMHSAGRAIALGTLAGLYSEQGLVGDKAWSALQTLSGLMTAMNIDWRVTAASALELVIESAPEAKCVEDRILNLICAALKQGLNDYTIDERGDVGSLVRLRSIAGTSKLLSHSKILIHADEPIHQLEDEIARLSLEKLDRVRLQAARCRDDLALISTIDVACVSSEAYFKAALGDIVWPTQLDDTALATRARSRQEALLQGCISCTGVAAEPLLQASRQVLAEILRDLDEEALQQLFTSLLLVLSRQLAHNVNMHPALELVAFLLDMQIPQRLSDSPSFKWRNLLSVVQKSHHKSNDIPRILAAVHVYIGLADVAVIHVETLKKLVSMLKTNPYPRVRIAVAEAIYVITGHDELRTHDWARPTSQLKEVHAQLHEKIL